MLYVIFFDSKGPVLHIPVPKGSSVTGKFYRESVFTQLVDFYQKRRPRTGVRGIKLLHDNAPAHKSATVQEYLKESGLDVLDHPPYRPDLSPCDFWLFPRLKEMLAGHHFESHCGIGSAVYQCLQHIPRVCAVDRHCRKMRQKNKCGARFFHLAKVCGDNFLSSNLNSTY